jgi:hypothetical protein
MGYYRLTLPVKEEGMDKERSQKCPLVVTRQELYRQVWQTPMQRLAAEYGISGNGLAKICDRLKIPYPPRGWWAKKAAGKNVATYRLPPADSSMPQAVTITPTLPKLPPQIQKNLADVQAKVAPLTVPARLIRPHRVISRWLEDHERRKAEARRERDPLIRRIVDPGDLTPLDRRRHRILDTVFKELERDGGNVKENDRRRLVVELSGESIEFQLREKQKQVRRPLTEDEKRWHSSSERSWRQELEGTGRLTFSISTFLDSHLRKEWLESEKAPMESLLPEIVATLIAAGSIRVEMRRKREEAERQRQIEQRRRAEEQERLQLNENRWRRMTELADAWRRTHHLREFITTLKEMPPDTSKTVAGRPVCEWLEWAEDQLKNSDPLVDGVEGVFADIARITAWSYRD